MNILLFWPNGVPDVFSFLYFFKWLKSCRLRNSNPWGTKICLIRLLLCGLYESLGLASQDLKQNTNLESLQVGGLIWILQLWLNATFKPSLKTRIPPNSEVEVEGPRLTQLTPDNGKLLTMDVFDTYFNMLYTCKSFISTMAPFSSRWCGIEWFRKPFPNPSCQDERDIPDTLLACFQPTCLWTRLTSSKSGMRASS